MAERTMSIDKDGRRLFDDMRDCMMEHDLVAGQNYCVLAELLVFTLLVATQGRAEIALTQFENLIDPIREGIANNAYAFAPGARGTEGTA